MKSAVALFLLFCSLNLIEAKNIENIENAKDFSNQITVPEMKKTAFISVKHRRAAQMPDNQCSFDALINFGIMGLIRAAEKNADCSKVAAEIFQRNYADKQIRVEKHPNMQLDQDVVGWINDLPSATNAIKHFGHLIRKLSMSFTFDENMCKPSRVTDFMNLLAAIDAHCRQSLVDFELHYAGCNVNNIFNQFKGPFQRLEILTLELFNMNDQIEQRSLKKVFPNVRELNINLHHLSDPEFISKMPKLEKLGIGEGTFYDSDKIFFVNLLQNNPRITHLSLAVPTFEALKYVEQNSKHLQNLRIIMPHQNTFNLGKNNETEEIHFQTVERVDLRLTDECHPPNELIFSESSLRDIELSCPSGTENSEYLNFLLKYPKIQKLTAINGLNNAHLMQLVGKFPNLMDAEFDFDKDVSATNIIEFVKKAPSLNRLEFVHTNIEHFDEFEKQLQTEFGTDFNIEFDDLPTISSRIFFIERKIPILIEPEKMSSVACQYNSLIQNTFIMFMIAYSARFFFI